MLHSVPRLVRFALLVVLAACRGEPARDAGLFRGVYVSPPVEKPDFTFTDFNGQPFSFRLATEGKVALLFFGYTHCPDVCPLHAANVSAVLRQMPFDEASKIQFVFVTTDPERDTPERLKQWLGAFDPRFIGLRGSPEELARVQAALQIAPARKELPTGADSASYLVGHAAQVIAFGLDGKARTEYPMGVRQDDWAADLPRLARGEVPTAPRSRDGQPAGEVNLAPAATEVTAAAIEILAAVMAAPPTVSEGAVYLVVRNNSARADTLLSVWSPEAEGAMIHSTTTGGRMQQMEMKSSLPIGAGETLTLAPGATHLMLTGLRRLPAAGESFPLRLRFARAGEFIVAPMVVPYADVQAQLGAAR